AQPRPAPPGGGRAAGAAAAAAAEHLARADRDRGAGVVSRWAAAAVHVGRRRAASRARLGPGADRDRLVARRRRGPRLLCGDNAGRLPPLALPPARWRLVSARELRLSFNAANGGPGHG